YKWALFQAAPTRQHCATITSGGSGYGTDNCSVTPGTLAYDATNPTCTTAATASRCHGTVFFGPGTSATALAMGADIGLGTNTNDDAGCMGQQRDVSPDSCYSASITANSYAPVHRMGTVGVKNNVR